MNENALRGLKRASWLFALLTGIGTVIFVDDDIDGLVIGLFMAIVGFIVARIAIWVVKGFSTRDIQD